jgi:4-amino-4-deoxy-L-arabinose transferase-like glycosyltransferase
MLLWGVLGLGATYVVCQRLASARVAWTSVFVLATCPLYFLHARTALGDIATMASLAVAFAGLLLAVFDPDSRWRSGALSFGVLGLVAGFYCRGALVGVALPCLSVGFASLLVGVGGTSGDVGTPSDAGTGRDRRKLGVAGLVSGLCIAVGLGSAAWGAWAAWIATPGDYYLALGGEVTNPKQFATHDYVIQYLGHGLFPWSAVVPLALGFVLRTGEGQTRPELALRSALFLMATLGVGVYSLLSPRWGLVPFGPVFALAGVVAFALVELDRRPSGVVVMAMVSAALLVLFYTDFQNFPEKGFSAFGVSATTFPESFEKDAKRYAQVVVVLGALACVLLVLERVVSLAAVRAWFQRCGDRLKAVRPLSRASRALARTTFVLERLSAGRWRGSLLGVAVGTAGLVMSFGYYPALGAQLSPVGAFDAYRRLAGADEPLGLVGERSGALLLAGEPAEVFKTAYKAAKWLNEGDGRRWLVAKQTDLASLNSRHRRLHKSAPRNIPLLDDRSSQALLLSNELRAGEEDLNPLAKFLPDEPPRLAHPLDAELDERLRVLGWEVRDDRGKPVVNSLRMGRSYEFVIAYEVLKKVSGKWQTFIHMDGDGKRFNGDHDTLQGEYDYRYWSKGDYVLDIYPFELESRYTPGKYEVYFGLFSGDKRMPVTRGKHSEDRIIGGTINFRH